MTRTADEDAERLAGSAAFDADWYREAYPDVAASGLAPAAHYLWLGAKLGRSPLPPGKQRNEGGGERLDALFIDGAGDSASTHYRVRRIAAGLAWQGWTVRTGSEADIPAYLAEDGAPRFVIVHRAPFRGPYPEFIDAMRARGAVIVFDIDDLLFDPALIPHIDAFRRMTVAKQQEFRAAVDGWRDFVLAADLCTASTTTIVEAIERLGKPAWRVRNSLAPRNLALFDTIPLRPADRPTPFTIGYYSGTATHQADFATVAPALAEFMRERSDVHLRLVGALDLAAFPDLADYDRPGGVGRVTRVSLMPHDTMLRDQLACDLIIAPLEVGNPFCEAKSELKFFEAALTGRPVIAASTATFREATEEGRLALLAGSADEWLAALRRVHDDHAAALDRADRARRSVREHYPEAAAATEAAAAYRGFLDWRDGCAALRARTSA